MNNQDLKIGTAFISMINFPLGFLVSLIEVINGYRWGNFLFAFILGLLAFSLIPYSDWDLTRHYETYLSYNNTSFSEVWEQSDNRYLVINTIIYLFNAFAIKKEFLPFFAVFISYLFYLNVFSKFIREKKPNILIRSIYLYILLTVIPFFAIASSLRQYLAFSIILYIIITYCSKQDRRTFLISFPLVVMAIGIHPSVILLIALFLFSRFIRLNRIVVLLIFFILVLNFNGYISIQLFKLFKPLLMNTGFYYPEYMDAEVIHMNNQLLSMNEFILNKLILPSIFYLLIPVFLIFYKKSNSKQEKQLKNYCALLLLTICLLSLSPDLFYRFSIFWTLFYSYIYFTYDSERMSLPAKQCYLVIIIVASCVINLAQANMGKKIIYNSWGSFFYQPSLFVFVKEIKTTDYINVSQ